MGDSDHGLDLYERMGIPLRGRAFIRGSRLDGIEDLRVFGAFVVAAPVSGTSLADEDAIYDVEIVLVKRLGAGKGAGASRLDQVLTSDLLAYPERLNVAPEDVS